MEVMVPHCVGVVALDFLGFSPSVLLSFNPVTPQEAPQASSATVETRRRKELDREQRQQHNAQKHEEKKGKQLREEVEQQIGEKGEDVKSAFMQADSTDAAYITPTSNMRRRLEGSHQIQKTMKPAAGNVRAPRHSLRRLMES